jgi:hypothetical protein
VWTLALAMGKSETEVVNRLKEIAKTKGRYRRSQVARFLKRYPDPRIASCREVYEPFLQQEGWKFQPCSLVGKKEKVHLNADELPTDRGKLICRISKRLVLVKDGVMYDIYDPSRNGTRQVYGYYYQPDMIKSVFEEMLEHCQV